MSPYDDSLLALATEWERPLGALGQQVAHVQLLSKDATAAVPAALHAVQRLAGVSVLSADLVGISTLSPTRIGELVLIANVELENMDLSDFVGGDYSNVRYLGCIIPRLDIDAELDARRLPRFEGCMIGSIDGPVGEADLPPGVFDDGCYFEHFSESTDTTSALLSNESLPIGTRVLMTILRKTFVQAGAGRKENGLVRGLDQQSRELVPEVLSIVAQEDLLRKVKHSGETIWLPARAAAPRVYRLLESPSTSKDPLISKVRNL